MNEKKIFQRVINGILITLLMGATTLVVVACTSRGDTSSISCGETTEFPTGRFVREHNDNYVFEFDEDGTYNYSESDLPEDSVRGIYGKTCNLYTEMTHDSPGDRNIPVTYTWTYDGQKLTFHLWGEDLIPHRKGVYDGQTYIKVK